VRRVLPVILLVLLALPGWPWLVRLGLLRALPAFGLEGRVGGVTGYALFGLRLRGVDLEGDGFRLKADSVRIDYNLLGLLAKKLPLRLRVEGAELRVSWKRLLDGQGPAGQAGVRPVMTGLVLKDVRVLLDEDRSLALPPLTVRISGEGPYDLRFILPSGTVKGRFEAVPAPRLDLSGDLAVFRYWYPEIDGGRWQGTWRWQGLEPSGRFEVFGGRVRVAGFPISEVRGRIRYRAGVFRGDLEGQGLGGPVSATGTVDVFKQQTTWEVSALPEWRALAAHFGWSLPLGGRAQIEIQGGGWGQPVLEGSVQGAPEFLGYGLKARGDFAYRGRFTLSGRLWGRFYDRDVELLTEIQGGSYRVSYRDDRGSRLELSGSGPRGQGSGELVLPSPLTGKARLTFAQHGRRWQLVSKASSVSFPLSEPFDLSGAIEGEGDSLSGQLGPLRFQGTWRDLALVLQPLRLRVGTVEGFGRWRGALTASLAYVSPYARFPIEVEQAGSEWRFGIGDYGEASYSARVFRLRVSDVPLELPLPLRLSADVTYGGEGWAGRWQLFGPKVRLAGTLHGEMSTIAGSLTTPWGGLGLAGRVDAKGVLINSGGLSLEYRQGQFRLWGRLSHGPVEFAGDLGYKEGAFRGRAEFGSPWLRVFVSGLSKSLRVRSTGWIEAEGTLFPRIAIAGRVRLPPLGGVRVPELPFVLSGAQASFGSRGEIDLARGRFRLAFPAEILGQAVEVRSSGDLRGGEIFIRGGAINLAGSGPWQALDFLGRVTLPGIGALEAQGTADLFRLGYRGRFLVPGIEGAGTFEGVGRRYAYRGRFRSGGALEVVGSEAGHRLWASGFSLKPLGLPLVLEGSLAFSGDLSGDLTVRTPWGRLRAVGARSLTLVVSSSYLEGTGSLDREGFDLALFPKVPGVQGVIELSGDRAGLRARGQGTLRIPGFSPEAWRLELDGLRWRLDGPIKIQGQGLRWRARVAWPTLAGPLEGWLEGEGLVYRGELGLRLPSGEARMVLRGDPVPTLSLTFPGGQGRIEGGRLESLHVDLSRLLAGSGIPIGGEVSGSLGPGKRLSGRLLVFDRPLWLSIGRSGALVWSPDLDAGFRLRLGERVALEGIGALSGRLGLWPELSGSLRYSGRFRVNLGAGGTLGSPRLSLSARGLGLTLEAGLEGARYRGTLAYRGEYGAGSLAFSGRGGRYRGEGTFKLDRFLPQSGPLRLSGNGPEFSLTWDAPMKVVLTNGPTVRLSGRGEVVGGGVLEGEMRYASGAFAGQMRLSRQGDQLLIVGEGPLRLEGRWLGASVKASLDGGLGLRGDVTYRRRLGTVDLEARLRISGDLLRPLAEGSGRLQGRDRSLVFRFGYDGDPWFVAQDTGLFVRLRGQRLEVRADAWDLSPYLGLPVRLSTGGSGPIAALELPLELTSPWFSGEGRLAPAELALSLNGRLLDGRFELLASPRQARLALDVPSGNIKGVVRWQRGAGFSGGVGLSLAGFGGRLSGWLDPAAGTFDLEGTGSWSGNLRLDLKNARAVGALHFARDGLGGIRLRGQGRRLAVEGEGPLEPLRGTIDLAKRQLSWSYRGGLPAGLGELAASGTLPGVWLLGSWRLGGHDYDLRGLGDVITVKGPGLWLRADAGAFSLQLDSLDVGWLRLSGAAFGRWRDLEGRFRWAAGPYQGRFEFAYDPAGVRLQAEGDVSGTLAWQAGRVSGRLRFPYGEIAPRAGGGFSGQVLGRPLSLEPGLRVLSWGGLRLDIAKALFSGKASVEGVEVLGQGRTLRLAWRDVVARIGLKPLAVSLEVAGRPGLRYQAGRVAGELRIGGPGYSLSFKGNGREVAIAGRVLGFPGLPLGLGRVSGAVGLDGRWTFTLEAAQLSFAGQGQGLTGEVRLSGKAGHGAIALGAGGVQGQAEIRGLELLGGRLDLALAGAAIDADWRGPYGAASARATLSGFSLSRLELWVQGLDLARVPWVHRYLPQLRGRLSGGGIFQDGTGLFQFGAENLGKVGEGYPFSLLVRLEGQAPPSGTVVWGTLRADYRIQKGRVFLQAEANDFPLDLPLALGLGELDFSARMTGAFKVSLPLNDPARLSLDLAAERLRLGTPKGTLTGTLALVYDRGTLRLRSLDLEGAGTWRGAGSWRPGQGGDLRLVFRDTDFSPFLRIFPALKPYRIEVRGDLDARLAGQALGLKGKLAYSVEGVEGELEFTLDQELLGDLRLRGSGRVRSPVTSRFELWGQGRWRAFRLTLTGDLDAPLLAPIDRVTAEFRYPSTRLLVRAGKARLEGVLSPLDLRLEGLLPLEYPEYYLASGEARSQVRMRLASDGRYHVDGEVEVLRAVLSVPESRLPRSKRAAKGSRIVFDGLRLYSRGGIVVNEALAQGELAGEVFLSGSLDDPYLSGRAMALSGSFLLLSRRFTLLEGWAEFFPELGLYPRIYVRARTETPKGPLYLVAEGHFVREGQTLRLAFDPCLARQPVRTLEACKILPQEESAKLLLGLGEGEVAQQAADVAVKNLLIGQLEKELARSLGLDLLQIETSVFNGGGFEATTFTVGKYVTPELFLAYRLDLKAGSRFYASYRQDGLQFEFSTDLSPNPSPTFSLSYALTPDVAFFTRLSESELKLGLEWKP